MNEAWYETQPKTIVCFGDSNTFGTNPSGGRWGRFERWTGQLQKRLGEKYYVVEEGCGGRTTVFDDPIELHKNGRRALPVVLATHKPIRWIVVMLGTNDMKQRFHALPDDIAQGAAELIQTVLSYPFGDYPVPRILLVSPIQLGEGIEHSIYTGFSEDAVETSRKLAARFEKKAREWGCSYLDAAEYAVPSTRDQLHMELDSHTRLAERIAEIIKREEEGI